MDLTVGKPFLTIKNNVSASRSLCVAVICILSAGLFMVTSRSNIFPHLFSDESNKWEYEYPVKDDGHDTCRSSSHATKRHLFDRFDEFFEDEKVLTFRRSYVANMTLLGHSRLKIYTGVMEPQSGGHNQNGFGSVFNNMLNAYVIASRPEVRRFFQILQPQSWKHANLLEFFEDFAENSTVPLFPVINSTDIELFLNTSEDYSMELTRSIPPRIHLKGPDKIALRYIHKQFSNAWDLMFHLVKHEGESQKIFQAKTDIMKAIWNLKVTLKNLVRKVICSISDTTGRYLAVHLRRTDKITSGEMKDIPVEKYLEEISRYCQAVDKNPCPRNIFVMSDDHGAYLYLKRLVGERFRVFDLSELLVANGERADDYVSCLSGSMLHNLVTGSNFTRNAWHKHTREIIISITALALSDHLICTFSSNICKLAVFLRGDHSERFVHSLDKTWDPL